MLKDNEVKGIGNSLDFGERWMDTRIARLGMSRDKLYRNFPGQSPYVFGNNSPIAMTDKGGNHAEIVITKTGSAKSAQIAKVDVNVVYYTTIDREKRLSGDLNFYSKAQSDIKATYGADGNKVFTGKVGNTAYNATFNIDIKQPLQNKL